MDGAIGLLVAHDFHRVETLADERVVSSFRCRKFHGIRSSLMSDQRANFAGLVGMSLLKQAHAQKQVGRKVFVEPNLDFLGQSVPVAISAGHKVRVREDVASLVGVPDILEASVSDVLGRARD